MKNLDGGPCGGQQPGAGLGGQTVVSPGQTTFPASCPAFRVLHPLGTPIATRCLAPSRVCSTNERLFPHWHNPVPVPSPGSIREAGNEDSPFKCWHMSSVLSCYKCPLTSSLRSLPHATNLTPCSPSSPPSSLSVPIFHCASTRRSLLPSA